MFLCDGCETDLMGRSINGVFVDGPLYVSHVWVMVRDYAGDSVSPEEPGKTFCQKCSAKRIIVMLEEFLAQSEDSEDS